MTQRRVIILFFASITFVGLSLVGCSQANKQAGVETAATAPSSVGTATAATLSPAQAKVVQDGVKVMIANPDTAEFSAIKAVTLAGSPGVHVCGYVTHKAAGGRTPELPFYLELRDQNGAPAAHRGQVGSDDAKRAKVKFVCRHSGS